MNRRNLAFAVLITLMLWLTPNFNTSVARPQNLHASLDTTLNPSLSPAEYDFGDAPEGYHTVLCAVPCDPDAAHHIVVPELLLGATIDKEVNGQPSIDADGDGDDDDGITLTTPMRRGSVVELSVTVTGNGLLQGWVDFDGKGWWDEEDRIMTNTYLTTGSYMFDIDVPDDAWLGLTYARFRFSTQPDLGYGGEAPDGEVEDYAVEIAPAHDYDYGDMPDDYYHTLLAHNGARHLVVPGIRLGREIDGDPDGQPGVDALGDDQDRLDDEDGVTFTSALVPGEVSTVEVVASAWGRLDAFVDFDGDNYWTLAEQIFDHEPLVSGVNYLSFSVPTSAATGLTYARFRFRQEKEYADAPYGEAINGEVEDYQVRIEHLDWGDAPDVDERPKITKITASDGMDTAGYEGEQFGRVAIDGDNAVVGAIYDDLPSKWGTGSAYVYHWDGSEWIEQQKLYASDAEAWACFGTVSSISGERMLIGVGDAFGCGGFMTTKVAYMYHWDAGTAQWEENQKLSGDDTVAEDLFGISVSLSGDWAIVGAPKADLPGKEDAGAAYLFHWTGTSWVQQQKLLASDAAASDLFGRSVAIDGDRVIIGAPSVDLPGMGDAGAAYVFHWDGWQWIEHQKLISSIPESEWRLGWRVSLDGDHIAVGRQSAGLTSLYHWYEPTWIEVDSAPFGGCQFGLSISGDNLIGGMHQMDDGRGRVYLYHWDGVGWELEQSIEAPNASPGDRFGAQIAISGSRFIVGATGDDEISPGGGAAYIFEWTRDDDDYPTLFVNDGARHTTASGLHLGSAADFDANGHPSPPGLGDDYNGFTPDDEDGINFTSPLAPGATATLDVVAAMPAYIDTGYLDAWIDFNGDGDWDDEGEQIFASQFLQPGTNNLAFPVPAWAVPANQSDPTFARFRYSSTGGLPYYGPAADGEVEDYPVEIMAGPRPPDLNIRIFSEEEVELYWDHVTEDMQGNPIDVTAYRWYKSQTPYFDLGAPWQTWYKGAGFPAVIAEVAPHLQEVEKHHFYKVVSVADGGAGLDLVSVPSNEVGEFEFALFPGSEN